MYSKRRLQPGFSLLDTLLGVGLFLVVSTALVQFTLTILQAGEGLSNQLLAQNLARGNLEILENLRGTNVINFVSWTTPEKDHPRRQLASMARMNRLATDKELCVILASATGVGAPWTVTPLPTCPRPEDRANSPFFSYVRLEKGKDSPLLADFWQTFQDTRDEPRAEDDLLLATAVVRWETRGVPQELTLTKVFTDWHP